MDPRAVTEQKKYDGVWQNDPLYRECSPGELFAPRFFEGFKGELRPGQTLIDFGCGTARASKLFLSKGLKVSLVDISPYCLDDEIRNLVLKSGTHLEFIQACLWQLPKSLKPAYWAYCCDVMEHIPEDYVDAVLKEIAARARYGAYFSICLKPDLSGKRMGAPLHLTVKDAQWWKEALSKHFTFVNEQTIDEIYYNCCLRIPSKELKS